MSGDLHPPAAGASLQEWLRYQEQLHPRSIELGLGRALTVAQRLGLLMQRPLTLTIGGTNGKGSSATLAALICREAGHRVGLYTSPHLLRYNERVEIDGEPSDDAALCAAFAEIERVRGATPLTYFEFGTLAALWLFRRARVDVQVLEVGLGGRLDAVNIVDADGALVTSIGLDHQDWLGPDREAIGGEKAGIFREGRPSVCADPVPPQSLAAAQLQLGRDFRYRETGVGWDWEGKGVGYVQLPRPGLAGRFQLQNAAGVLALLAALPALGIGENAIRAALPRLRLPGRFQRAGRVVLDVAHNVEAAEALVQTLQGAGMTGGINLVLGMLADKPVEAIGRVLARVCRRAYLGSLPGPRGLEAEALAGRLGQSGLEIRVCADLRAAFAAACEAPENPVLVTGSFLTVAEIAPLLHG